jgi:2Fe-2S ferredoxin
MVVIGLLHVAKLAATSRTINWIILRNNYEFCRQQELGERAMEISVETREGRIIMIEYSGSRTIMEAIRDSDINEIEALCGGQLTCATCHIYVDADHLSLLPPKDCCEEELLESSDHYKPTSRLACQIPCSEKLSGIRVIIAPRD